jgi:hypothetical protein
VKKAIDLNAFEKLMSSLSYIPYLMQRKFSELNKYKNNPHFNLGISSDDKKEYLNRAEEYELQLASIDPQEVKKLWDEERAKEAEENLVVERRKEASYIFNQSEAQIDCVNAAQQSYWTLEECVAYSLGKDPSKVNKKSMMPYSQTTFGKEFFRRINLIQRGKICLELSEINRPNSCVQWFKCKGISFSDELVEIMSNKPGNIIDLREENQALRDTIKQQLKKENEIKSHEEKGHKLHGHEKKSLQQLFIGIAALFYGEENIKNVKASEISKDLLEQSNIDLNVDTVRKHLKDSLKWLPITKNK